MKKTTTAAIAASVGAALLLGGAGTLAYWTDTETSGTQNIASGNLDLGPLQAGNWKIQHSANGKTTQPVDYNTGAKIVPGDILTQTVQVPVTLVGENMKAKLTVNGPKVEGDATFSKQLTTAITSINGQPVNGAANGITLTPTSVNNGVVPVTVSVTYPFGTQATKPGAEVNQTVSVSSSYTLEQVAAAN